MSMKKILAGMSAAAIAAVCFAMPVSAANKLTDYVYPTDDDEEMNKSYYSIGGMGFFMNQSWNWNQGDWVTITEDGKIQMEYKISPALADTTMSGKGTLGSMGIMITNLPDNFPFDVKVEEAKFVDEDGNETVFESVKSITEAEKHPEGGFRIVIRGDDEVDEETGEVKQAATPEAAGWQEEGAFNGGTLYITVDLTPDDEGSQGGDSSDTSSAEDSKTDDTSSKADDSSSKADESSKTDSKAPASSSAGGSATAATSSKASPAASSAASDNTEASPEAGAAASVALAVAAAASAAVVVAKKRR